MLLRMTQPQITCAWFVGLTFAFFLFGIFEQKIADWLEGGRKK